MNRLALSPTPARRRRCAGPISSSRNLARVRWPRWSPDGSVPPAFGTSLKDRAPPRARIRPVSLRGRSIVALLTGGLRNPEIANRLFLSAKTVDHHVSSILAKLGVRNRAEVVREAARLGLLEAPVRPAEAD